MTADERFLKALRIAPRDARDIEHYWTARQADVDMKLAEKILRSEDDDELTVDWEAYAIELEKRIEGSDETVSRLTVDLHQRRNEGAIMLWLLAFAAFSIALLATLLYYARQGLA